MRHKSKRVPSALKHGIYSGIGLLPTESRAKFRKFKKQLFADLNLVGWAEENVGEQIAPLEWRRQHFFTYDLLEWARARRNAIRSDVVPELRYLDELPVLLKFEPHLENPSPEELKAAHRRADKRIQSELGAALELVDLGELATVEYLEKRLAVLKRLDEMIACLYKKLALIRGIKSMAPRGLPAASPVLLGNAT
jgi:hypothetical protein